MKTKFIDFILEVQKENYIDISVYDFFNHEKNIEEPYEIYKKQNIDKQNISFSTWEISQFPKYEEKIKTLLDRHYNEKKYLSDEEMEDLTFIFHEFRRNKYTGSEYYKDRDNEALVAFLVHYNRITPYNNMVLDKYNEIYIRIKTCDDYEPIYRSPEKTIQDTNRIVNRVKFN